MKIKTSEYITSSAKVEQCPPADRPEYAFIGRSNVGKSSLINMLTGRKKLVKVSGTPGKTITINHFLINREWYLVDLPGYGYAKRSKTERQKWNRMIRGYILKRSNLLSVFLLVDTRHEPQKADMEFIDWLGLSKIPFALVFTKEDKLNKLQAEKSLARYKNWLLEEWEELPPLFVVSSRTGKGKDELLSYIEETNQLFSS
ncbi:MAG: YihA family ribosome biogenesis GTP-binding protein [Bacteroidetes bacterium]|nr:MAG: YihA family ribosome biogenesis GTP-binding protein [Bacteroidota bacterium]RLD48482.1 MAG: YihA family ribosome biogenesis GTP-binding protein [Bacteroidota bacterium]RLD74261.1 MAG: YihA family ribosome biogenesis GTP-binding protein [Bacteroidota bacterium]RLD89334.1 MAG: YihA family ribosome biogenesis GTP-binding protein [Bacteroidota bacterium]